MPKKKTIAQVDSLYDAMHYFVDDAVNSITADLKDVEETIKEARERARAIKGFPGSKAKALKQLQDIENSVNAALEDAAITLDYLGEEADEATLESKTLAKYYDPAGYKAGHYPDAE